MTTTATIMTDLVEDLAAYSMNAEVMCAQPTYVKNSWNRGTGLKLRVSFLFFELQSR
jgi:methanogenic corrinoid protein MtbC1